MLDMFQVITIMLMLLDHDFYCTLLKYSSYYDVLTNTNLMKITKICTSYFHILLI